MVKWWASVDRHSGSNSEYKTLKKDLWVPAGFDPGPRGAGGAAIGLTELDS